jgi:hypothetical protein
MKNKSRGSKRNPKRGGPGFLLCCETGREFKCQREALDILNYYYFQTAITTSTKQQVNGAQDAIHSKECKKELSMEEEIALLKSGVSADVLLNDKERNQNQTRTTKYKNPFQPYDTGCRGTVFLMYNQSKYDHDQKASANKTNNSDLVEDKKASESKTNDSDHVEDEIEDKKASENKTHDSDHIEDKIEDKKRSLNEVDNNTVCNTGRTKKQKHENGRDFTSTESKLIKWDPLVTARSVINDVLQNRSSAPSSRFVTRMIPIQLTCFANMEEIILTSRKLIKQHLLPFGIKAKNDKKERPTFKIDFKRRICSSIKRDEVISAVADSIQLLTDEYWSDCAKDELSEAQTKQGESLFRVDLNNAEYTVMIETCRTLVGMSVVKDAKWFRNFNLTIIKGEAPSTG